MDGHGLHHHHQGSGDARDGSLDGSGSHGLGGSGREARDLPSRDLPPTELDQLLPPPPADPRTWLPAGYTDSEEDKYDEYADFEGGYTDITRLI